MRLSSLPLAYVGTSNEWESTVATAGCANGAALWGVTSYMNDFNPRSKTELGAVLAEVETMVRPSLSSATALVMDLGEASVEVNANENLGVRASCLEFVLAGLYATDRISRSQKHGRMTYEIR